MLYEVIVEVHVHVDHPFALAIHFSGLAIPSFVKVAQFSYLILAIVSHGVTACDARHVPSDSILGLGALLTVAVEEACVGPFRVEVEVLVTVYLEREHLRA